jgi:hypothetical protein
MPRRAEMLPPRKKFSSRWRRSFKIERKIVFPPPQNDFAAAEKLFSS